MKPIGGRFVSGVDVAVPRSLRHNRHTRRNFKWPLMPSATQIHKPTDPSFCGGILGLSAVNMCGIMQSGICRLAELTPGQFGLTKQLVYFFDINKVVFSPQVSIFQVLRIALPHVSLLVVAVGYAIMGSWVLTAIKYSDGTAEAVEKMTAARHRFADALWKINRAHANITLMNGVDLSMGSFQTFTEDLYHIYLKYPKSLAIANKKEVTIFIQFYSY